MLKKIFILNLSFIIIFFTIIYFSKTLFITSIALYCILSIIFIIIFKIILNKYVVIKKEDFPFLETNILNKMQNQITEMDSYFSDMFSTLKYQILEQTQKEIEISAQKDKAEILRKELQELNDNLEKKIIERTINLEQSKLQAEKANNAKDEFLAKLSHELRTPLTPIIGFSKELLYLQLDPKIKRKILLINSNGTKLLNLTNELLEISKLEFGHTYIFKSQFNLKNLIEEIYLENVAAANKKGILLKVNYPINGPFFITTDQMKLYKIINNLVVNAIKYTDEGYVYIYVELNDNTLHLRISDSGVGIPRVFQEKMFNSFEQLNYNSPGLGLGLNIVKNLISILEGNISLVSKENYGSQFFIEIPVEINKDFTFEKKDFYLQWTYNKSPILINIIDKALLNLPKKLEAIKQFIEIKNIVALKKIVHEIKGTYGNLKISEIYNIIKELHLSLSINEAENINYNNLIDSINKISSILETLSFNEIFNKYFLNKNKSVDILIAEDNIENSEYLEILFNKEVINLKIVKNGLIALNEISKKNYDIILLDIQMPIMGGIETLKNIKKQNIVTPIIALTAQSIMGDREKLLDCGFDDYISKPIDTALLFSIIKCNLLEENNETFNC